MKITNEQKVVVYAMLEQGKTNEEISVAIEVSDKRPINVCRIHFNNKVKLIAKERVLQKNLSLKEKYTNSRDEMVDYFNDVEKAIQTLSKFNSPNTTYKSIGIMNYTSEVILHKMENPNLTDEKLLKYGRALVQLRLQRRLLKEQHKIQNFVSHSSDAKINKVGNLTSTIALHRESLLALEVDKIGDNYLSSMNSRLDAKQKSYMANLLMEIGLDEESGELV